MTKQKATKRTSERESTAGDVSWPGDAVERRAVAELVPYAKNARTHSDEQIATIARSITEFGFTVPVLIDERGGIIAGHGRVMAAKSLNLTDVPVMVARGWSEDRKRAYVLADNKIALASGWDEDLLRGEIEALRNAQFDLGTVGFSSDEIDQLFNVPTPPSLGPVTLEPVYQVLIECKSEADQLEVLKRLQADGINCRALIA